MSLSSDGRAKGTRAPRFENLEERLMLTTVYGGQIVEYLQPVDGDPDPRTFIPIRMALGGDIVVELVGMNFFGEVGHMPARVTNDPLGGPVSHSGGLGGFDGVDLIGPTPITDPDGVTDSFPWPEPDDENNINISALASHPGGPMFLGTTLEGVDSLELVGATPVSDTLTQEETDQGIVPTQNFSAGDPELNLTALASQSCGGNVLAGSTYGFNVYVDPADGPMVQLVRLNVDETDPQRGRGEVVANLADVLPFTLDDNGTPGDDTDDERTSRVIDIMAADFRPMDGSSHAGWLYFVVRYDDGAGGEEVSLFALNVAAVEADRGQFEMTIDPDTGDHLLPTPLDPLTTMVTSSSQEVVSIAWDQTAPTSSVLYGFRVGPGPAAVVEVPQAGTPTTFDPPTEVAAAPFVDEDGDTISLDGVTGIEFVEDDPTAGEDDLWVISNDGTTNSLYYIDLVTTPGQVTVMGELDDADGDYTGGNLQGMAWNPYMGNPWTDGYVTMIGTDPTTDELVHVRVGLDSTYAGTTYGINVYQTEEGSVAQLLRLNNATGDATVVADLTNLMPAERDEGEDEDDPSDDIFTPTFEDITGADFRPMDGSLHAGWLYFSVHYEPDDAEERYGLFAIDVAAAEACRETFENRERDDDRRLLELGPLTETTQQDITSLAWDQTSPTSSTLYASRLDSNAVEIVVPPPAPNPNIIQFGAPNVILSDADGSLQFRDPEDGLVPLSDAGDVTGIEFVGDDPLADERYLWAIVEDGADSQLVRIDLTGDPDDDGAGQGLAVPMGFLHGWNPADPSDTRYPEDHDGPVRGDNLQGMAWNPVLPNPYVGGRGAMIATDITTDELVYIRTGSSESNLDMPLLSGGVNLFAIYVSYAGEGASISLAEVNDDIPERPMDPFSNNVGSMYSLDAQTGDIVVIDAPDTTGRAVLGATTIEFDWDGETDNWLRILEATVPYQVGARPVNYDGLPESDNNLSAGLRVPESLLEYMQSGSLSDNLLGMNLDDIRAMAVSRAGRIVVADFDGVNAEGVRYADDGDGVWEDHEQVFVEIALIDPVTGRATDLDPTDGNERPPANLLFIDRNDDGSVPRDDDGDPIGRAVREIRGLDYGDLTMDGNEQLYAVAGVGQGGLQLGRIDLSDYDSGWAYFDPVIGLESIGVGRVTDMAFSPGAGSIPGQQGLFLIDSNSILYEVNPIDGSLLQTFGQVTGAQHYPDGTVKTEVVDGEQEDLIEAIYVQSMDFDDNGILYAHDRDSGRLVDIDLNTLQAGTRTHTSVGSLRPTVGAMSYDFARDRFLAVDNLFGAAHRRAEGSWAEDDEGVGTDLRANDSSAMMVLRGIESESAVGQSLRNVLIGGPVMGQVHVSGSVDLFYGGWIVTGEMFGIDELTPAKTRVVFGSAPIEEAGVFRTMPDNFYVGGDLRNLITVGSLGNVGLSEGGGPTGEGGLDAPTYLVGFDLHVGGKVGQIWSMGAIIGAFDIENQGDVVNLGPNTYWQEIEWHLGDLPVELREGVAFQTFHLLRPGAGSAIGAGDFFNDTYETAQFIGTSRNTADGNESVHVAGNIADRESCDYYALSLMAGQTVTVWLENQGWYVLNVGIFDPDGRLVATDSSDVDPGAVSGMPIRFTATRAGAYRFAVGANIPFDNSTTISPGSPYVLHMTFEQEEYKDLGVGAILADEDFFHPEDPGLEPRIHVRRGDLGAIMVERYFFSQYLGGDIQTSDGNLRTIEAASTQGPQSDDDPIGTQEWGQELWISVLDGSVGLIRTTDPNEYLTLEQFYVEGDVQTLEAAGMLRIGLTAFGGLGNLRAGTMASEPETSSIHLNADGFGRDGIIDLIDVAGDFGSPTAGGPWIFTGEQDGGGNVRFIRVGGEIFQCLEWADGTPVDTDPGPGVPIMLTDDSGTDITIIPVPDTVDEMSGEVPVDPLTGEYLIDPATDLPFVLPSVSLRYFGIMGGGVAIVDITATDSIEILTDSHGDGSPAEIGNIILGRNDDEGNMILNDDGRAVVIDDDDDGNGAMSLAPHPYPGFETDLTVLVRNESDDNPSPVDIWEITGGNFTSIRNETGGEIVNITADSIGELYSAGSLGVTAFHNGAEVDATIELSNFLPFMQQTIGIVSGDIITARAGRGLGNFMVDGTVGQLAANYDGRVDHTDGDYRGIVAPVHITGDLYGLQIGEGIAPTGTGEFAQAGVFVEGEIRYVTNQGRGSDIHGDIFGALGIREIELVDGAIINADIFTFEAVTDVGFTALREYAVGGTITGNIGQIILNGVGGIIGAYIRAGSIGRIEVNNGFGLFNSTIGSTGGNGVIGEVIVDGYGLHDVQFQGGGSIDRIVATGHGDLVSTLEYTPTARYSEQQTGYDPFDRTLTDLNDIHEMLLTTVDSPMAPEGILSNVDASGQLNLGFIRGYQFITEGTTRTMPYDREVVPMESVLTFANAIGTIIVEDEVNGLRIETGRLGKFRPGADVYGLDLRVAGTIGRIAVTGDLADSSSIQNTGANALLSNLSVAGDFDGQLLVDGRVGNIVVRGDLSGYVDIDPTNEDTLALRSLLLDGSLSNGSMNVGGHVGRIRIAHDLGQAGDSLTIHGNLGTLQVGTDRGVTGSSMMLDLNVVGDLGVVDVTGKIEGDVYVKGTVNQLAVRADEANPGDLITGELLVLGALNNAVLDGGALGADVTVGDDIGTFRILDADLPAPVTVTSSYGDIARFDVVGGDLFGTVTAVNGDIGAVNVTGSDFGGTLSGLNLGSLRVDGSILAGAAVTTPGEIAHVAVRGDVEDGATVEAGSARAITVNGDWEGLLDAGYTSRGTSVRIDGNLGGDLTIDGSADLTIGTIDRRSVSGFNENTTPAPTVSIGMDLTSLVVRDEVEEANIFVDGRAGAMRVGSLIDAVVTTGYDLQALVVSGAMSNSLVQVGVSRGYDDRFADGTTLTADYGETGRMATLGSLTVGDVLNYSIVAAGGDVHRAWVRNGMSHTSLSSGLNVGSEAIATLINLGNADDRLDGDAELYAARSGGDRQLLRGDVRAVVVNGTGMVDSAVSAGVDAGASGDFANLGDNGVAGSLTGGASSIGAVRGDVDPLTAVVADAGIRRAPAGVAFRQDDVTYAVSDIDPADEVGTAIHRTPAPLIDTAGNPVLTVTLIGPGYATLYDEAGGDTDNTLDTLVIRDATHRTRIDIVSAGDTPASIGRIITEDDVELHSLTFEGGVVGDGTAEPDLVLDGGVRILSLGQMGGDVDWDGRIGGDVRSLSMDTQAHGTLRIGGRVVSLDVNGGAAGPLLVATAHPTWPDDDVTAITSDTTGNVWMYDAETETLHLVSDPDPANAAAVTDAAGNAVSLAAMDVLNAGNVMYALATVWNQAPTSQVGAPQGGEVDLVGLAVDGLTNIYAIENASSPSSPSGQDELMRLDPDTGIRTSVGMLRDVYSNLYTDNVMALACDNDGTLFALIRDFDGDATGFTTADGISLAAIETVDTRGDGTLRVGHPHSDYRQYPAALLNGGGVTDDEPFTAMAVDDDGRILAIRRINGGAQDQLVELEIADDGVPSPAVTMTVVGTVEVFGADTTLVGMGFDENGNLIAYNNDGASAELVVVDTATPADSSYLTVPGALDTSIDHYAFGRTDSFIGGWDTSYYDTYAYDTDNALGNILYTNPGLMETIGTVVVDAGTGTARFSPLRGLSEYAETDDGAPLSGRPASAYLLDMAFDNADTGHVFVIGDDGRLFEYERMQGTRVNEVALTDSRTGQTPSIGWIEFDDATGELIGFDTRHDRLVTIDTTTGATAPRIDSGVMSGDLLTDITYDPSAGTFFTFNTDDGTLYRLRGTTQADLVGITAASIDRLRIDTQDAAYHGRIATTGNTLRRVSVVGDFDGHLAAGDDIQAFSQVGGDFAGSLVAGGSIMNAVVRGGNMLVNAVVDAGRDLRNLQVLGGEFAGALTAATAGFIRTGGLGVANDAVSADDFAWADVNIRGQADRIDLGGAFTGFVDLASAGSVTLGSLVDGAYVRIAGDADSVSVRGDGAYNTFVNVLGELGHLSLGGTHEGVVAVQRGIGAARLAHLNQAIIMAGEDTGSVAVRGDTVESVLSFGTWIGDDLIYNSDDDVITGGSLGRAVFGGEFTDSAVVAGVLPNLNEGTDIPTDNMWAYVGNANHPIATTDAADAGGVLASEIGLIVVRGNVVNSQPAAGRLSAAAAADGIERIFLRRRGTILRTRDYTDPFGAPTIIDVRTISDSEIRLTFSEEMNSASLSLAQDVDGNGSVNDPWDIPGTVSVRDADDNYFNDVRLTYSTVTDDLGDVHGVLSIVRDGGFDAGMIQVEILGETDGLAAYDRSGLRSALRNPDLDDQVLDNEDRAGTLLDGDANGIEGGNFWLLPFTDDVGNTFDEAWEVDLSGDGQFLKTAEIVETFETEPLESNPYWTDSDVFSFTADAGEFFSLEYFGSMWGTVALFHLDDGGEDPFHELVARYENTRWYPGDSVYQAFELPADGTYYVVVGYQSSNATSYTLQLALASSDDMLDGAFDGATGVPSDETIAYVSNRLEDNNNYHGYDSPMQLVYLDFDGGETNKYYEQSGLRDGPVEAMEAGWLDSRLEGLEEELINGNDNVTGIVENIMTIYETLPGAGIGVHRISTLEDWQQAVEDFNNGLSDGGLYFTTVDPATWDLDADSDFTTVFFGRNHLGASPNAGGLASDIDVANMSKADNALVFANNYAGASSASTLTDLLNEYARVLGNTGAHELGHTLGLNHQPTVWEMPDETILLEGGANAGAYGLMAYPPLDGELEELSLLGVLPITPTEFVIGDIDTADMILRWLA
ncbi:MAG: hypothetical protein ACOC95_02455 [Planctomycetota bacterium]